MKFIFFAPIKIFLGVLGRSSSCSYNCSYRRDAAGETAHPNAAHPLLQLRVHRLFGASKSPQNWCKTLQLSPAAGTVAGNADFTSLKRRQWSNKSFVCVYVAVWQTGFDPSAAVYRVLEISKGQCDAPASELQMQQDPQVSDEMTWKCNEMVQ